LSDGGRVRQVTWPAIEAHRDYIVGQLKADVTVSTISARLIAEKGLTASRSSLRRWIVANLSELTARSRASVPRGLVPPGSEAQIDYGKLGSWTDPATGTRHTIQAFVMVLACSRLIFVRPVIRMDQTSWCESHVEAFAFFGGVPARLVPDNLKTGVDRPDLYDPRINRAYAELAVHYRCDPGSGQGVQAEGQASGRARDAVRAGLVLAWPGVHQFGTDAGRGDHLVP
jgi:transposase